MPTATLLLKAYNDYQLKSISTLLKTTFEDLKTNIEICGTTSRRWVRIAVSGEDEKIAMNYLIEKIGLCPARLESLEKSAAIKGRVVALEKDKAEILVDIGVFSPNIIDAAIPLHHLQAQLVDGRKIALGKLIELFDFCEDLPLTIRVPNVEPEENPVKATLAQKQLSQYGNWTRSLLDRLIILGVSFQKVKSALDVTGCNRDVVGIEPLGLVEHAVVCKLGTDGVGLIPRIGSRLGDATFSIFSPRRILKFLGDESSLLLVD